MELVAPAEEQRLLDIEPAGHLCAHAQATLGVVTPAAHERLQHGCDLDHSLGQFPCHQGLLGRKDTRGRGSRTVKIFKHVIF
jgi:hypothetical protein